MKSNLGRLVKTFFSGTPKPESALLKKGLSGLYPKG